MAIQSIAGSVALMQPPSSLAGAFTYGASLIIDAADEGVAFILRAPATGNISKLVWRTGTVTTGCTVDVRLETVDTTVTPAIPTGTLKAANSNGAQVVANADDNVLFTTALTAAASVTRGDLLAIVIKNPTASFGTLTIAGNADDASLDSVYSLLNTGVSPAVSWGVNANGPICALCYDVAGTDTYYPIEGAYPASLFNTSTISTSTTPDVVGLRFQLPFPASISGAWIAADVDGAYDLKLVSTAYNQGAGTGVLATASVAAGSRRSSASGIAFVNFVTPYTIAAGTNYRLVIEPTSGTSLSVYDASVGSLAMLDCFPGGQNFHLTTAKDPTQDSDWTNYNSGTFRRPFIGVRINGFDDATGGGSSLYGRSVQGIGL
jgi:hypothetical protein